MSADGTEEREIILKLREHILSIGALAPWLTEANVVHEDTLEDGLKHKFDKMLIVVADITTNDKPNFFGSGMGLFEFSCFIYVVIRNPEGAGDSQPSAVIGTGQGPGLPVIDGHLRNGCADADFTLGGYVMVADLGAGAGFKIDQPERCVGRVYPFTATKEVER